MIRLCLILALCFALFVMIIIKLTAMMMSSPWLFALVLLAVVALLARRG